MQTPPDDCGGAPGYEDFLQAMADPQHPEDENTVGWLGHESWDANAFDLADVKGWLVDIKV